MPASPRTLVWTTFLVLALLATPAAAPANDTTPPAVAFTSPADNTPGGYTILDGTVALSANASDNVGVASVSFYFGSTLIATDTAAPYSASLDTSKWPDGQTSKLQAIAKDAAGNQAGDSIYVKIVRSTSPTPPSDTTAPTVTLTSPADNPPGGYTYLTGTVTASANASDNVGVASVSFYFGSSLIATDTAAPYSASLDTSKWPDGQTSTLKAVAKDAAGNQAGDSIYVKIGSSTSSTATISPSSLPGATVGVAYSQQLSASGPKPPYSFKLSLGSLPSGLSLSSAGLLSGTPSASGSFAFTVAALDSGGASATSQAYTLAVVAAPTAPPPPSSSWPASYRSGPMGAANILPPHQGVLSGFSPGGPGCGWSCMQSRVLQRETQRVLGRQPRLLPLHQLDARLHARPDPGREGGQLLADLRPARQGLRQAGLPAPLLGVQHPRRDRLVRDRRQAHRRLAADGRHHQGAGCHQRRLRLVSE